MVKAERASPHQQHSSVVPSAPVATPSPPSLSSLPRGIAVARTSGHLPQQQHYQQQQRQQPHRPARIMPPATTAVTAPFPRPPAAPQPRYPAADAGFPPGLQVNPAAAGQHMDPMGRQQQQQPAIAQPPRLSSIPAGISVSSMSQQQHPQAARHPAPLPRPQQQQQQQQQPQQPQHPSTATLSRMLSIRQQGPIAQSAAVPLSEFHLHHFVLHFLSSSVQFFFMQAKLPIQCHPIPKLPPTRPPPALKCTALSSGTSSLPRREATLASISPGSRLSPGRTPPKRDPSGPTYIGARGKRKRRRRRQGRPLHRRQLKTFLPNKRSWGSVRKRRLLRILKKFRENLPTHQHQSTSKTRSRRSRKKNRTLILLTRHRMFEKTGNTLQKATRDLVEQAPPAKRKGRPVRLSPRQEVPEMKK